MSAGIVSLVCCNMWMTDAKIKIWRSYAMDSAVTRDGKGPERGGCTFSIVGFGAFWRNLSRRPLVHFLQPRQAPTINL